MVSVPLIPGDFTKTVLYPSAISEAFAYAGSYVISPTLQNGVGYWIRFSGNQTVPITGLVNNVDTIAVSDGWNMVGSISSPVAVSSVMSIPNGLVTSQFFGYSNGYQVASTIQPGSGYWVKVNGSGSLILSSTGATAASRIRITPTSERPPLPPDGTSGFLPKEFSLQQNYPNPFNPATVVNYSLPVESKIRLIVYNMLGQCVATLVDGVKQAGYNSIEWNGSNSASGIYYYRLDATSTSDPGETFTRVKKMLLVK